MLIDKLEPFLGDTYQSRQIWNFEYLIKKKKPVMDDWEIICHAYIWTEIDLD